jgi:hypothetical protein
MSTVNAVTPVVKPVEDKLTEVKVTIVDGKESAVIIHNATESIIKLAFSLQDDYENESQYRRDSLQDAAVMFLKAECARAISRWDNLVTKMSKTPRYKTSTREQVEASLKDNPKCKPFWTIAQKAATIKKQIS